MLETTPLSYHFNATTDGMSRLAETCQSTSAQLESIPSDSLSPTSDCNGEVYTRIDKLEQGALLQSNTNKAYEETLNELSKKIMNLQMDNDQMLSTLVTFKDSITKTVDEFIEYQMRSLNEANNYYQLSQAPQENYGYTIDVINDMLTQANLPTIPETEDDTQETDDDLDIDEIAESIQKDLLEAQYDPLKDNTIDRNIAIALSKLLTEVTEQCSAIITSKLQKQQELFKKKKKHVDN